MTEPSNGSVVWRNLTKESAETQVPIRAMPQWDNQENNLKITVPSGRWDDWFLLPLTPYWEAYNLQQANSSVWRTTRVELCQACSGAESSQQHINQRACAPEWHEDWVGPGSITWQWYCQIKNWYLSECGCSLTGSHSISHSVAPDSVDIHPPSQHPRCWKHTIRNEEIFHYPV